MTFRRICRYMKLRAGFVMGFSFLCLVCLIVLEGIGSLRVTRVTTTYSNLELARQSVKWFRDTTGRFPDSLADISEFAAAKNIDFYRPGVSVGTIYLFIPELHREMISNRRGSQDEHTQLNDEGGFFYDSQSGDVKVNLTKPLRCYFLFYLESNRNEIPADW